MANEARRFNVAACGRRWGKSLLGQDLLIQAALDGLPASWFAPAYKYLSEIWRDVKATVQPITKDKSEQERRIELVTGGVIEMWSLDNPDAGRGRKYGRAIIDEAAMVSALKEAWDASIRPTLMDMHGDAWFYSTPKGHDGFWQLYQLGVDGAEHEWASWQFPTASNPYIDPSEIEAMRRALPERIFAQEVLAEFMDDAGGVFRQVMAAATLTEQEPNPAHQYIIGVDWGKQNDFTALSVIDVTTRQQVYLDRFNQIDYRIQRQRLMALAGRYHPKAIVAESNSMGEPIIDELRHEGLPMRAFLTTGASKAQIIEGLALAFETGAISILSDPVQVGELQSYEMTRLPSGGIRYHHPDGMHDDTVMALAIAWDGASAKAPVLSTASNPFYS